jgi:hypothetical protein
MADWLDDILDAEPSSPAPAPAAPAAPVSPAPAPAPAPPMDPATAAAEQIKAIRANTGHPMHPSNHRGDPSKEQAWDALYQQAFGASTDPAYVAPSADDVGGWGAAAPAVADLRDLCSREGGHLPPFGLREMTTTEFDTLVESCCLATGDSNEAKRLVSEISLALWNSPSLDRRAEQEKLRQEWGEDWDDNLRLAARAVAQVFPDHAAEAGKFVAERPRLMRLAVAWAQRQARRGR